MPYITAMVGFGQNQIAYMPEWGARDTLAMIVTLWIQALAAGRRIAVYCSDMSGAFDRVKVERLIAKLRQKRIHPDVITVLASWLRRRTARVVVKGRVPI